MKWKKDFEMSSAPSNIELTICCSYGLCAACADVNSDSNAD